MCGAIVGGGAVRFGGIDGEKDDLSLMVKVEERVADEDSGIGVAKVQVKADLIRQDAKTQTSGAKTRSVVLFTVNSETWKRECSKDAKAISNRGKRID